VTKHDPLSLLIELQRRARDETARAAARSRREAATAGSTLRMLQDYGEQHRSRAPAVDAPAVSVDALKIRDAFGRRLAQAIGEQDTVTRRLEDALAAEERRLLDRQRRLDALEMLEQRRRAIARQRSARQEQRQTDEHALQSYLRARREDRR
jgi:flagellar FliJ protein